MYVAVEWGRHGQGLHLLAASSNLHARGTLSRGMRTLAILLAIASLFVVAPAVEAGPGSGAHCVVQEEYVTEATVDADPSTFTLHVEPGAPRPVECYY